VGFGHGEDLAFEVAGGSGMASLGFILLTTPSPFASTLAVSHLEGRNCTGPVAPALEGPMFAL
jgi:hypothetical protein